MYNLSDLEKDKLVQFNTDEVMMEAVRKVLLASLYSNGVMKPGEPSMPTTNAAFAKVFADMRKEVSYSDAELGADLRALAKGINQMEVGFNIIKDYKKEEIKVVNEDNPAI